MSQAVQRYGRAAQDIIRMKEQGYDPLLHHRQAFGRAGRDIDALRPGGADDIPIAMNKDLTLIGETVGGQNGRAIRAMIAEGRIRTKSIDRADRFVAEWQGKARQLKALERHGDADAIWTAKQDMHAMATALHRDPQLGRCCAIGTRILGSRLRRARQFLKGSSNGSTARRTWGSVCKV